jgi:hypothetical protein
MTRRVYTYRTSTRAAHRGVTAATTSSCPKGLRGHVRSREPPRSVAVRGRDSEDGKISWTAMPRNEVAGRAAMKRALNLM